MEESTPIITDEQIEKLKQYLQSDEGRKKIAEICKPESDEEKFRRRSEQAMWWHRIKDIPFTI